MRLVPGRQPTPALPVRIVPMRARHLRRVAEIDRHVYPRPWTLDLYRGELRMPEARRLYLVARAERTVVGHAGLTMAADEGHVTTIAVDPAWQGRGVGSHLLLALMAGAVERGAGSVTLEVRVGNERAIRLYERFGFTTAGTRAGYYSESSEDALIMWAHGVDTPEHRRRLARIESDLAGAGHRKGTR